MPQCYTKKKGSRLAPDNSKYLFNIDTLWLNIDSYFYNEVMELGLRDRLIEGREHYSDYSEPLSITVKVPNYENELMFDIMGAQPPQYQYSIRNDSYAFYFAKSQKDNSSSMKIQINQFVLWEKGVINAYNETLDILKSFGFLPCNAKLNRVDFACHSDQWKWNIKDFDKFEYPRNLKDDNHPNFFKVNPSTLDFGTCAYGDRKRLYLRIYNKSKEILDKKKYYFYEIYEKYGMDYENIWNIEFEIHRPYLKSLKEETEDNLLKAVYDDWEYTLQNDGLSRLWSHLMDKFDHPSQHWKTVAKGQKNKFTLMENINLKFSQDIDSNFDREVSQIYGRLVTAVLNDGDYSLDNAIQKFRDKVEELEEAEKIKPFLKKVEDKKRKIASSTINDTIRNYNDVSFDYDTGEIKLDYQQILKSVQYDFTEIKKDLLSTSPQKLEK